MNIGWSEGRSVASIVVAVAWLTVTYPVGAGAEQSGASGAEGGETKNQQQEEGFWIFGSVESGYEHLREDGYLRLDARLALETSLPGLVCEKGDTAECSSRFRAGLQAPLRLRVQDSDPANDGVIRREDWDDVSDIGRTIRRIEYGRTDGPVHLRVGELGPATLGHGTLMQAYYNVISPGNYQLGVTGHVDFGPGGGELVVDNAFGPDVFGVRGYVRPLVMAERLGAGSLEAAGRWMVGLSAVSDLRAPYTLASPPETVRVGPEQQPSTTEERGTVLIGVDTEYRLVDGEAWSVSPYADFNHHVQLGSGAHVGSRVSWRLDEEIEMRARGELRVLGPRYFPSYVGPLYEVTRYQMTGWGTSLPAPKLRAAADGSRGTRLGGYGEWGVHIGEHSEATVGFEEYAGQDNGALRVHVQAAPNERFQIGGFYYNRALGGVGDLVELESSLLAVETRVQIVGPMYATGGYGHLWELRGDGQYESIERWMLGLGVSGALTGGGG